MTEAEQIDGWQPFATAPRDGSWIIARLTRDPEVMGERFEHWAGRAFVVRCAGDDRDWLLFPGFGCGSSWFAEWHPLPAVRHHLLTEKRDG